MRRNLWRGWAGRLTEPGVIVVLLALLLSPLLGHKLEARQALSPALAAFAGEVRDFLASAQREAAASQRSQLVVATRDQIARCPFHDQLFCPNGPETVVLDPAALGLAVIGWQNARTRWEIGERAESRFFVFSSGRGRAEPVYDWFGFSLFIAGENGEKAEVRLPGNGGPPQVVGD